MIKALATDLDGTLFYPKRKKRLLSSANRNFLKDFIDEGNKVVLVTGRNKVVSSKVASCIGTNHLTIIGCNGAFTIIDGEVVNEKIISHETAKKLYSLLKEDKKIKSIMIFTDKVNMIVDDSPLNPLYRLVGNIGMKAQGAYNEPYVFGAKYINEVLNDESYKIYKIMPWYGVLPGGDELARLASIRYREIIGDEFEIAWSKDAVEFVTKGANKALALEEVIKRFNISKDEIMVIGDSGNDVPLFKSFPNSYVMSHAPEEVKKEAKTVVDSVADLRNYYK